jgi:membrane protease YdiL (CAAX protease family)
MSWWKPLVVLLAPPLLLVVLQVLLWPVVAVAEGSDDPFAPGLTPLKLLTTNLLVVVTALLTVLLLVRMTGAPWRSLITSPRAFDPRRLAQYGIGAALLVGVGIGAIALLAPGSTGWTTFGITGTTVALLVVVLLTTPLQAAGEEVVYRSAALPAAASWVRPVRPALVVGLVVSSLTFSATHGSTDPWLVAYFALFGACAGLTAIISGGIEAAVALHATQNVLTFIVGALMAGGGILGIDRSSGVGGPFLLIPAAAFVGMVVLVLVRERRARPTGPGPLADAAARTSTPADEGGAP